RALLPEEALQRALLIERETGERLRAGLEVLRSRRPDVIAEVRGKGLLVGVRLLPNNREFIAAARARRLLVAGGGDNCIRLLPPLVLTTEEADQVLERVDATCAAFSTAGRAEAA
ncbi:aminotransferase class III-fold pyridoxal phosphate-dependent enzyme, partial [Sphingomonas bacterium]|uniref:aminotransferase class III-fold pyridoxal phosphate-dependent enzyme n=1 Tax=Sphingomonas bacterium TaxID=1895847 RepID=UPI001576934C